MVIAAGPEIPDPGSARSPAELVSLLRRRKVWAGDPSYDELSRRTRVPRSTLADALSQRRTTVPAYEVMMALVRALGAGPDEQDRWRLAWRAVVGGVDHARRRPTADTGATDSPVPAQLPAGIRSFVGREDALLALELSSLAPDATPLVAVTGPAGVGKTALAVQWGRSTGRRWADGQLFIRLRGHDPVSGPLDPAAALEAALRALGVPGRTIPSEPDERAGLYRSVLSGRRLLLVLDDAACSSQVRPLLPAAPTCFTVVTSRHRLDGLVARDDAHLLPLDVLPLASAVDLLRRLLGDDRVRADLPAAARLAELCDRLPLALRIVAADASSTRHRPLAEIADELSDEQHRLERLSVEAGEVTIRATLGLSVRSLSAPAGRLFRLLGSALADELSGPAVVALAGAERDGTGRLLDNLEEAHLLQRTGSRRYRMHELVRLFAREQAGQEQPADLEQARDRLLDWYAEAAAAGERVLSPHRPELVDLPAEHPPLEPIEHTDAAAAMQWFDAERSALLAAVDAAAATSRDGVLVKLVDGMFSYLQRQHRVEDWARLYSLAVAPARRLGPRVEVLIVNGLGIAHAEQERVDDAVRWLSRALELREELADVRGAGVVHMNMGTVLTAGGRHAEAEQHLLAGLALIRRSADRAGEAVCLNNLGYVRHRQGDLRAAEASLTAGLAIARELAYRHSECHLLNTLGEVHLTAGQLDRATADFRGALTLAREVHDRVVEGQVLASLGETLLRAGDIAGARTCWEEALPTLDDVAADDAATLRARLDALGR